MTPTITLEELLAWNHESAAFWKAHLEANPALLDDPALNWDERMTLDYPWLPPEARSASRRKVAGHALFHCQRHWAQLATLVRAAGFSSGFKGDLLLSQALK